MALIGYSLPDTLTDDAGNTLKGVTVTVTGPNGYTGTATSNASTGILRLGPLPVGEYVITLGSRSISLPVIAADADVVTEALASVPGLLGSYATTASVTTAVAAEATARAAADTAAATAASSTYATASGRPVYLWSGSAYALAPGQIDNGVSPRSFEGGGPDPALQPGYVARAEDLWVP